MYDSTGKGQSFFRAPVPCTVFLFICCDTLHTHVQAKVVMCTATSMTHPTKSAETVSSSKEYWVPACHAHFECTSQQSQLCASAWFCKLHDTLKLNTVATVGFVDILTQQVCCWLLTSMIHLNMKAWAAVCNIGWHLHICHLPACGLSLSKMSTISPL